MPQFGYDEDNELGDDDIRARNGLKPKPRMKEIDDPTVRDNNYITPRRRLDRLRRDRVHQPGPDRDRAGVPAARVHGKWPPLLPLCDGHADPRFLRDPVGALRGATARYYNGVKIEIYYIPATPSRCRR